MRNVTKFQENLTLQLGYLLYLLTQAIRYDTIEEINVDSKAEYTA